MANTNRMTDRSQKVMALAELQAIRLNCPTIEPEHVLIALAEEGSGVAANVLKSLGISHKQLVANTIASTAPPTTSVSCSDATNHLIEVAYYEARLLNHNYIGTEHLLLAICRYSEGPSLRTLAQLGVGAEELRREVLNLLGHGDWM